MIARLRIMWPLRDPKHLKRTSDVVFSERRPDEFHTLWQLQAGLHAHQTGIPPATERRHRPMQNMWVVDSLAVCDDYDVHSTITAEEGTRSNIRSRWKKTPARAPLSGVRRYLMSLANARQSRARSDVIPGTHANTQQDNNPPKNALSAAPCGHYP